MGVYSVPLNVIGFVFLTFGCITFNFPILSPVNEDNMNYTSAAIVVIGLTSVITWLTTGRKNFTGPQIGVENINIVVGPDKF